MLQVNQHLHKSFKNNNATQSDTRVKWLLTNGMEQKLGRSHARLNQCSYRLPSFDEAEITAECSELQLIKIKKLPQPGNMSTKETVFFSPYYLKQNKGNNSKFI